MVSGKAGSRLKVVSLAALALLATAPGSAAGSVVRPAAPTADAAPLALTDRARTLDEVRPSPGLADATLSAPFPASVTLLGTAMVGIGLLYRRRR